MRKKCDHDCQNCRYKDCINPALTADDYAFSHNADEILFEKTPKHKCQLALRKVKRIENPEAYNARQRKWRNSHLEQDLARRKRKYYAEHDETLAKKRAYYAKNPQIWAICHKEWYADNKEKDNARSRAYGEAHRDEKRKYNAEYYLSHKAQKSVYDRERYQRKKAAVIG